MTGTHEFRLLVRSRSNATPPSILHVPRPLRLTLSADGELQVLPIDAAATGSTLCVVEPIHRLRHSRELLLLCPGATRPLVDSLPAMPISVLQPNSQVDFLSANLRFDVTVYQEAPIRQLLTTEPGRFCALCRSELSAPTLVYECDCGSLLCASSPSSPEGEEVMSCLSLATECPNCNVAIVREGQYQYWPEDLDVAQS